jgi:hypothetical protein
MALTGSMRDFGISEILQLIGHQKKSGALTVTGKKRKVVILFDQGNIVKADHAPIQDLYDLGATLVRSGLLPPKTVDAAKAEAQRSLKPLPQVLQAANALEPDKLRSVITLIHLEILYSLFLWKDGDYSFDQGAVSYTRQWTEPISSEGVLMDGYRVKDEWPLLEKSIPDPQVQLGKVAGEFGPEDKLKPDQAKIYNLVDGERTALDIVFLSGIGQFETLKVLKDLVEKGRIRVVGLAAGPAEEDKTAVYYRIAAGAVAAVGAVVLLLGTYRGLERTFWSPLTLPAVEAREAVAADYQADRVTAALSLYAATRGLYPDSLKLLVKETGLSRREIVTRWGEMPYRLEKGGKACRLAVQPEPVPPPTPGPKPEETKSTLPPPPEPGPSVLPSATAAPLSAGTVGP